MNIHVFIIYKIIDNMSSSRKRPSHDSLLIKKTKKFEKSDKDKYYILGLSYWGTIFVFPPQILITFPSSRPSPSVISSCSTLCFYIYHRIIC